jgi:hypothetical protein
MLDDITKGRNRGELSLEQVEVNNANIEDSQIEKTSRFLCSWCIAFASLIFLQC